MTDDRAVPRRFAYDDPCLLIEWADGAVQRIPYRELRTACPCAVCQGEMGRPGRFQLDPELRPGEDELADIRMVGNYGLGAVWADGHSTGIHTFEQLRALGDAAEAARAG